MPNVPNLPGVPPLSSYSAQNTAILLAVDAVQLLAGILTPVKFGIFTASVGEPLNISPFAPTPMPTTPAGFPIVKADNVISIDYRQEWHVATYPVELGAGVPNLFESYDKVQMPYEVRLRFSSGGSFSNRQLLLDTIEAIAGDTKLYDVVTPEKTYTNVTVTHFDYRREAGAGAGMIVVDVWLQEIRSTVTTAFTSTQSPSGANPAVAGQAPTSAPTAAQAATTLE